MSDIKNPEQLEGEDCKKLVGFSLSMCVADIAAGKVDENSVEAIISGTAAETPRDFRRVVRNYKKTEWTDFPRKAGRIARRLYREGKIDQPRLRGHRPPTPVPLHWIAPL